MNSNERRRQYIQLHPLRPTEVTVNEEDPPKSNQRLVWTLITVVCFAAAALLVALITVTV